jgi:hypothetical protein
MFANIVFKVFKIKIIKLFKIWRDVSSFLMLCHCSSFVPIPLLITPDLWQ